MTVLTVTDCVTVPDWVLGASSAALCDTGLQSLTAGSVRSVVEIEIITAPAVTTFLSNLT